jgi:hypothetical protein
MPFELSRAGLGLTGGLYHFVESTVPALAWRFFIHHLLQLQRIDPKRHLLDLVQLKMAEESLHAENPAFWVPAHAENGALYEMAFVGPFAFYRDGPPNMILIGKKFHRAPPLPNSSYVMLELSRDSLN